MHNSSVLRSCSEKGAKVFYLEASQEILWNTWYRNVFSDSTLYYIFLIGFKIGCKVWGPRPRYFLRLMMRKWKWRWPVVVWTDRELDGLGCLRRVGRWLQPGVVVLHWFVSCWERLVHRNSTRYRLSRTHPYSTSDITSRVNYTTAVIGIYFNTMDNSSGSSAYVVVRRDVSSSWFRKDSTLYEILSNYTA